MLRVETRSGSIYDIDLEGKQLRRLSGAPTTVRATEEWKPYHYLRGPEVGGSLVIVWPGSEPPLPETLDQMDQGALALLLKATITSPVASIKELVLD